MPTDKIDTIFIALALSGIAIVLAVVFLFSIFINRKNKLIQKQLKDELDYQKRLYAIELNALRSQLNPHFVHNSLNAIQYYIQRNEVEISEDYLAKFSKLMRLFFEYSRKQSVTIREEIDLLENYLQIEKLRFEEKIEYSLVIDPKLDIEEEQIPSMILQPIVENAINHGLFHKNGKGHVTIQFSAIDKNSFKVSILDDGIGINKAKELNKSITKNKRTHSTSVLEERLNLLRDSNQWDIGHSIVDRSLNKGKSGTKVTLTFNQIP